MRYLLDTHTFLWWIVDDPRLSPRVSAIIQDPNNEIWFSAASAWEIAIKAKLGRIKFEDDPVELIPQQVTANGFRNLPIQSDHALHVSRLALLHRDPFDRVLAAQALVEKMMLLTADQMMARYGVQVVW
ncbi:MAG: type II toxin-antitoxin system VapC family toxin [Chloroflexota bacterium]|nr:MAG: type II toxin-antitoxin system VapC family toxin [Chloroflexota bacterium]